MLRMDTFEARVRTAALVEGTSYVLLLLGAMPLKYLAGMPLAVRVVGSLHGALFVWLMLLIAQGVFGRGRSLGWGTRIGVASLIPFGTYFLDRELREEDAAARARAAEVPADDGPGERR